MHSFCVLLEILEEVGRD